MFKIFVSLISCHAPYEFTTFEQTVRTADLFIV